MSEQQAPEPMTQEESTAWVREQFQRANKHLAENGVLYDSVVTAESRYLVPYVALWKIKALDNKQYWVMSGDLPVDFTLADNAATARDAIKFFAMHWQLKAENIRQGQGNDDTQLAFANLLQSRAESLFSMQAEDQLWQQ